MTFIPSGFWEPLYMAVLLGMCLFAVVIGGKRSWLIAGAMAGNWIGTRVATAWGGDFDAILTAGADTLTLAFLLLFVHSLPGKAIAGLFGCMLAFYAARDFGFLNSSQMWAAVDLLAYLQILIMAGGAIDDRGRMVREPDDILGAVRGRPVHPMGIRSQAKTYIEGGSVLAGRNPADDSEDH